MHLATVSKNKILTRRTKVKMGRAATNRRMVNKRTTSPKLLVGKKQKSSSTPSSLPKLPKISLCRKG